MKLSRAPGIHHLICYRQGRSGKWPRVRKLFLRDHPTCEVCDGRKKLEVHHVRPFHRAPKLELDPRNLITLCECLQCHILFGHLGNYRSINWKVRSDVKAMAEKIRNRP
jgi:5-methylcytosine-specific restriction endonuclease McrA